MLIKEDSRDSDITCIFMSGYRNAEKEEKRFEWDKSTRDLDVNRIFVIDINVKWYHDIIDELIPQLQERTSGKKRLIIGSSMGGYGALLAAHLLSCGSLTFSPQTCISPEFTAEIDPRWITTLKRLYTLPYAHPEYYDLSFITGPQHHLYFGKGDKLDELHAKRMKVSLFPQVHNDHNLAIHMKKQGTLSKVLKARIEAIKNGTSD